MKSLLVILPIFIIGLAVFVINEAMEVSKKEEFQIQFQEVLPCDLQKVDCPITIPNLGEAMVSITPRPIKMNEQLKIKLSLQKDAQVMFDFMGLEMDMGYNRPILKLLDNGHEAQAFLPACTDKQMTWQLTVLVKNDEQTYGYVYKFLVVKDEN